MNEYTILIYNGTDFIDFSSYISTNFNIQDKLDKSFDSGTIIMPHIQSDEITGFDLSKALKPLTPVIIRINSTGDTYRFYISDSSCSLIKKSIPKYYKHEISLVESTEISQKIIMPDKTWTQPKSSVFSSTVFSESKLYSAMTVENDAEQLVSLSTNRNSVNTSIIDERTIKAGNAYNVNLTIDVLNKQFDLVRPWYALDF